MELCELLVTIKLNELERAADRGELVLEALGQEPTTGIWPLARLRTASRRSRAAERAA